MRAAYEHIRPIQSNDLAKQMNEIYLEDDLADADPN